MGVLLEVALQNSYWRIKTGGIKGEKAAMKRIKGIGTVVTVFMVLISISVFAGSASAGTIYVPTDYPTIQQAIAAANPGDTVFVYNGSYYEGNGVNISKDSITLQGENANTTPIHGMWTAEKVVYVTGNYVNVSEFTVTGSASGGTGIYVEDADNCISGDANKRCGNRRGSMS